VPDRERASDGLRRAFALLVGLVALGLVILVVAGIIDGLHRHGAGFEAVLLVQGVIGPAALISALAGLRSLMLVVRPSRSSMPIVVTLVLAVPLALVYVVAAAMMYGS
jgi:uncharacterized membrane protein